MFGLLMIHVIFLIELVIMKVVWSFIGYVLVFYSLSYEKTVGIQIETSTKMYTPFFIGIN